MRFRRHRRRYRRSRSVALSGGRGFAVLGRRAPEPSGPPAPFSRLETEHRTTGEPPGARFGLRLAIALVLIAGFFSTLLVRLWSLQVVQGPNLNAVARNTTTRDVQVLPARGEILARGGQVLAGDVLREVVTLSRVAANAHPGVVGRLAALLDVSAASINADLTSAQFSPYAPVPIAMNVSPAVVVTLTEQASEFPGVSATAEYERSYPYDSLGAQTLGYVHQIDAAELKQDAKYGYQASDVIGTTGVEAEYELQLRGRPGNEVLQVDPSGDVVTTRTAQAPIAGDNVVLNMDLGVEQVLSSALSNGITAVRAKGDAAPWGAGVVLDAQTGAVLAMTSYPSYNNNWWASGSISTADYEALEANPGKPLNNYAVAGLQPPGSTFKLSTATAALDDGLITPSTEIDDTGSYPLPGGQPLRDSDNEALGWVNVVSALSESSDVFFYTLGGDYWEAWSTNHRYGETPIQDMAQRYGLGTTTGIDLPGVDPYDDGQIDSPQFRAAIHAEDPSVYPPATWYLADNVELAFGQGETLVTPVELATAYATFANGGTRYAPEVAAGIVGANGALVKKITPKVMDNVSYVPGAYAALLAGFEGTVQNPKGTAYAAFTGFNFAKWNLGGKTGTATVSLNDTIPPTSWFVGFGGPRPNAPKYVVAIEITQAGFGASAAAPVARTVFNYLMTHPVRGADLPKPVRKKP